MLNLAPMIDVTFLLLIFFSVTTTFKRAEGFLPAKLPTGNAAAVVPLPVSPIVIRIEQAGSTPGEYRLSIDHSVNRPTSFDELASFLAAIHRQPGFNKRTPVVIAAQPEVAWDHVVNVWNAATRAGCTNIVFGAERAE